MTVTTINGFPDYTLDSDGNVYCTRTETLLRPGKDRAGYIQVSLRSSIGKRFTKRVHRLLAEHFIPKKEYDGDIVDHIDNNRTNNKLTNLRWTTPTENGQNTSAKKRDSYCIKWAEDRKTFQVSIPQLDGPVKYIGCATTLEEAQKMRDEAMNGTPPVKTRLPTYCITHRPDKRRFEVSIPIGPRKYKYVGHGKTLEEAQQLRDIALNERDLNPSAWSPQMKGKMMYI
jgi:hypothetical protein